MDKYSCLVVFSPKDKKYYNNRRRFLISKNRAQYYIGHLNAKTLLILINNMTVDKHTWKLRKYGKIEIYVK